MFLAIRMALYGLFAALAGQGLEFITFDEATGQVDITFNIESLTTIAIGAVGFAGTFLASFWDRLRGPVQDQSGAASVRTMLAIVFGLLAISACVPRDGPPLSVEQQFFEAVATYDSVKTEAANYLRSGPLCSQLNIVGCVPDRLAIAIDDVTDKFDPQITLAVALFQNGALTGAADQRQQLTLARQAIRELSQTLAEREAPNGS